MCNEFAQERAWKAYCAEMQREALKIPDPDRDQQEIQLGTVKPSDPAVFVGPAVAGGLAMQQLRWGWPPPPGRGGLVINVRSENRRDPPAARGLVPFDVFYEFRDDGGKKKSKFAFRPATNEPLAFPVVLRDGRFSLMTCEPGPDMVGIHHRQPTVLRAGDWARWLADPAWPADLVAPPPDRTLQSHQVR